MDYTELLDSSIKYSPTATSESTIEKLQREAHLLLAGIAGFGDAARNAVSAEHALETTAKVAVGIGIGAGVAYLSRGRSVGRIGVGIFGGVATAAFATDVLLHARSAAGAITDTWDSPVHWDRNVDIMKRSVGQFMFDTTLMTAAGIAGGAMQVKLSESICRRSLSAKPTAVQELATRDSAYPLGFKPDPDAHSILPTMRIKEGTTIEMYGPDSTIAQLSARYGKNIVEVQTNATNPMKGTGFFVGKDGSVATCFHVVESAGGVGSECKVIMDGKTYAARIKRIDARNDLALLQTEGVPSAAIEPLPVANRTGSLRAQAEVLTLGFGSSNTVVVSPGKLDTARFQFPGGTPAAVGGSTEASFLKLSAYTRGGASGAPVFNPLTGEVIGVHCAGNKANLAYARPAELLRILMMDNAQSAGKLKL